MKQVKSIIFIIAVLTAMSSCSSENNSPGDFDDSTPTFFTQITRMQNSTWEEGDKVGLFMINGEKIEVDNTSYIVSQKGNLSGAKVSYPKDKSSVDFKSYYPYQEDMKDGIYKVDTYNQSDFSAIDLLYSDNALGKKYGDKEVNLTFEHQLSFVKFTLIKDKNIYRDVTLDVKVETKADFSVINGTYSSISDIKSFPVISSGNLFIPGSHPIVVVKIGNVVKSVPVNEQLTPGSRLSIRVNVTGDDRDFSVSLGSASIVDWGNDKEGQDIDIEA